MSHNTNQLKQQRTALIMHSLNFSSDWLIADLTLHFFNRFVRNTNVVTLHLTSQFKCCVTVLQVVYIIWKVDFRPPANIGKPKIMVVSVYLVILYYVYSMNVVVFIDVQWTIDEKIEMNRQWNPSNNSYWNEDESKQISR